jgi:hypothetical protein
MGNHAACTAGIQKSSPGLFSSLWSAQHSNLAWWCIGTAFNRAKFAGSVARATQAWSGNYIITSAEGFDIASRQ